MSFNKTENECFMSMALGKALEGIKKGQTPFGACIVKNGKILSCEHNRVWKNTDITAHAEIMAIRGACRKLDTIDLSGCVIFSTCEPCPMCFSAIHWAGIKTIVFGARISDAKKIGFSELEITNRIMSRLGKSNIRVVGKILLKENLELFMMWTGLKGRRAY